MEEKRKQEDWLAIRLENWVNRTLSPIIKSLLDGAKCWAEIKNPVQYEDGHGDYIVEVFVPNPDNTTYPKRLITFRFSAADKVTVFYPEMEEAVLSVIKVELSIFLYSDPTLRNIEFKPV